MRSGHLLLMAFLALSIGGCGDEDSAAGASTGAGSTSSVEPGATGEDSSEVVTSVSTSEATGSEGTSVSTSSDGAAESSDGTSTRGTSEACEAICAVAEACGEAAYLSCVGTCGVTVQVFTPFDANCGEASAASLECRYALPCEDLSQWIEEGVLEPDPCAETETAFIETCTDAAPPQCDAVCDSTAACEGRGREYEIGCAFDCLFEYARFVDQPECQGSISAYFDCVTDSACGYLDGACDDELNALCVE